MEAPITRLPPELLVMTFDHLEPPERTLCTMSHQHWRILISTLWPKLKTSPAELLYWAANGGHIECLKMLKSWHLKCFIELITNTVQVGNIKLCKKLVINFNGVSWINLISPESLNKSLNLVAYRGYIECIKLLRDWGATDFNSALAWAACRSNIDCMKLLKEWGATDFDWALNGAANKGQINCMKLLKKWGATNFNNAFSRAAEGGHLGCMKLLKDWGATDFEKALCGAAKNGHIDCMKLLKEWGTTYFGGWGARGFDLALTGVAYTVHKDCKKLLETWIKEQN